MRVEYHPAVEAELMEIRRYYEERSPGLGTQFVDEFERQVLLLAATKVGDVAAAYMKAKYTVANPEGREFKTLSRMWIIPRGSFMFLISMSGTQEGPDVSETEFKAILDSIRIEK
ncbi:MAG TPA: type II toxin-antitoxin system RelE/ParE family toxin [Verrucomicrobiales bacterium]|nr:type II toxin-antitoxin system RelE/ParE family toxin [Verrucomicrobiales bacterium]